MSPAIRLLVAAAAAGALAWASAQETPPPQPPGVYQPHEAPVPPSAARPRELPRTSPARRWWSRDGFGSVQVNVTALGQNTVGDAANEPSLAIDPTDPNKLAIGWRQFDTVLSNFRQAGWAFTSDGGGTWTFPGSIEPGVFRSDPVVDADAKGVFYYNSLTADALGRFHCTVFRSHDGGQTWDAGTYAWGGDKQWQAIDTTESPGRGHIYVYWSDTEGPCGPHDFTRSTDGGNSFEACVTVPGAPYNGTLAVGPDGELYVCGSGCVVAKSTDAKYAGQPITWTAHTVSLDGLLAGWGGPNPGGLLGQAWIAVDCSTGATRGNVYLLGSVQRTSTADPCDIMFARSTNGGQTWSAPVRINDDAPDNEAWQWFGALAVAPNGRIDAAWFDTRHDPGGYDSELYYSYSDDAGNTWSPNVALSPSFDPQVGWPQQSKMGDYFDMTADSTGTHLAYAATFNGEEDIFYSEVPRHVMIGLPGGVPDVLAPGQPTEILVRIWPGDDGYLPDSAELHYRYHGVEFGAVPLTPLGGDQYRATLPPTGCAARPEFYFSVHGTDGETVYQPPTAPAAPFTARTGQVEAFYTQNLDSDPGWSTAGAWAFGRPTGQGGEWGSPDPTAGHTGLNVYGFNLAGDYGNDLPATDLMSLPINCTGRRGVRLRFWRWLGVESSTRDHASIAVSTDASQWYPLWENSGAVDDGHWLERDFDLSPYADHAPTVYLRWTMGPTNSFWHCCGWNIDDVQLTAVQCAAPPPYPGDLNCDGLVDFDDINPLTLALAGESGYCTAFPLCNWSNADCNGDGQVGFDDISSFVALLSAL